MYIDIYIYGVVYTVETFNCSFVTISMITLPAIPNNPVRYLFIIGQSLKLLSQSFNGFYQPWLNISGLSVPTSWDTPVLKLTGTAGTILRKFKRASSLSFSFMLFFFTFYFMMPKLYNISGTKKDCRELLLSLLKYKTKTHYLCKVPVITSFWSKINWRLQIWSLHKPKGEHAIFLGVWGSIRIRKLVNSASFLLPIKWTESEVCSVALVWK